MLHVGNMQNETVTMNKTTRSNVTIRLTSNREKYQNLITWLFYPSVCVMYKCKM